MAPSFCAHVCESAFHYYDETPEAISLRGGKGYVYVCVLYTWHTCGGLRSRLLPSIVWVLGFSLRLGSKCPYLLSMALALWSAFKLCFPST